MLSFIYGSSLIKYAISLAYRKVRIMKKFSFPFALILLITSMAAHSQGKMDFEKYEPVSTLKVPVRSFLLLMYTITKGICLQAISRNS